MKTFQLKILDTVTDQYIRMIENYWQLEDGKFVYKPRDLQNLYGIRQRELNKVIAEYSVCRINLGECVDCNKDIIEEVKTQSGFQKTKNLQMTRCWHCERIHFERIEQGWDDTREALKNGLGAELIDTKKLGRLKKLNPDELDVLKQIIKLKDKSLIYDQIHNKIGSEKAWGIINKLQRQGLLEVKRQATKVVEFVPSEDLVFLSNGEQIPDELAVRSIKTVTFDETLDAFTFRIPLNQNVTSVTSPKYSKVFALPINVNFEKGVEYLMSVWVLLDGSLNVSFAPTSTIFRSFDRRITLEEDSIISEFPNGRFGEFIANSKGSNEMDNKDQSENHYNDSDL